MGLALITALVFGQTVYAPPDVPRDHWAFGAVNEMFREGLLKGYPAITPREVKVVAKTAYDKEWLKARTEDWRQKRILVDNSSHPTGFDRSTRYELAVMVHATLVNSCSVLNGRKLSFAEWQGVAAEIPTLFRAAAMLKPELEDLQVDSKEMTKLVQKLNDALKSRGNRFS